MMGAVIVRAGQLEGAVRKTYRASMLAIESRQLFLHIEQMVAHEPRIELHRGISSLVVPSISPTGFDISVSFDHDGYVVMLDHAVIEMREAEQARSLVEDALAGLVRLKIDLSTADRGSGLSNGWPRTEHGRLIQRPVCSGLDFGARASRITSQTTCWPGTVASIWMPYPRLIAAPAAPPGISQT